MEAAYFSYLYAQELQASQQPVEGRLVELPVHHGGGRFRCGRQPFEVHQDLRRKRASQAKFVVTRNHGRTFRLREPRRNLHLGLAGAGGLPA